jgi:hypothetical protein
MDSVPQLALASVSRSAGEYDRNIESRFGSSSIAMMVTKGNVPPRKDESGGKERLPPGWRGGVKPTERVMSEAASVHSNPDATTDLQLGVGSWLLVVGRW